MFGNSHHDENFRARNRNKYGKITVKKKSKNADNTLKGE